MIIFIFGSKNYMEIRYLSKLIFMAAIMTELLMYLMYMCYIIWCIE